MLKHKLVLALAVYAAIAAIAWQTLEDERLRNATLLFMLLFAVLTYTGYRRHAIDRREE